MSARKDLLREGLDLQNSLGLEIGPLCWPTIRKSDGPVTYVDHADTPTLREKYARDPNVDVAAIVEIDAVWGQQTLSEAIEGRRVDYVIASHVAEHVPDLITWLAEVGSILNPKGQLRLALPDRRFSFDYLRRETALSDVLTAHILKARRPQVREIVDFKLNVAPNFDNRKVYSGEHGPQDIKRHHTLAEVIRGARRVMDDETFYYDVHCWVFTARSFAVLMEKIAELDLLNLACAGFHDTRLDTGFEFFVSLTPSTDRAAIIESWRSMAEKASEHIPGSEAERAALAEHDMRARAASLDRVEARMQALETALAATHASTSWRITAPLRAVATLFRRP